MCLLIEKLKYSYFLQLGYVFGILFLTCNYGISTAQTPTSASTPARSVAEALKDIPPSGQSCRRDDIVKSNGKSADREDKKIRADLSCGISAQELNLWLQVRDMTALDVRPTQDYTESRIANAINIATHDVKHKSVWKQKSIALVGSGKNDLEIFSVCADLKDRGFKSVKVLAGGMLSWQLSGLHQLGNPPAIESLNTLNSAQLFTEAQFEANLVVLSASRSTMLLQLKAAVVAQQDDEASILDAINSRLQSKTAQPVNAVVWVAPVSITTERIKKLQTTLSSMPKPLVLLIYYEDDIAFQKFVTQQNAMWSAQARGPKQLACGL
jgi:rhodanese-related sulfurtransferase